MRGVRSSSGIVLFAFHVSCPASTSPSTRARGARGAHPLLAAIQRCHSSCFPRQAQPAHFSPFMSFNAPFSTTSLALSKPHFFAGSWNSGGGKDGFLQDTGALDHLPLEHHSRGKKKQMHTHTPSCIETPEHDPRK